MSGLCRIGVFYDGSFVSFAQRYYYHNRNLGWFDFKAFHTVVQELVRNKEQDHSTYKIVYSAWFQGSFPSKKADERHLRNDRTLQHDAMHAGIDLKYLPMSMSHGEKGIDVALAVDALGIGLAGKIDIAVLVTGDGDFVPLARELMKNGVRVMVAYFDYKDGEYCSFANERLLSAANYELNISALETDKDYRSLFKSLFRQPEPERKSQASGEDETR